MPILGKEQDLYPDNLLSQFITEDDQVVVENDSDRRWWALYTLARHEKQLMRKLLTLDVPFYGPVIPKRTRSPAGRVRVSYGPLFSGYVFIYGDDLQRSNSLTTRCVSKWFPVPDQVELIGDLWRIKHVIDVGKPLTAESRLDKGDLIRVKSGPFAGIDGYVIRRERETRLLVWVNFTQQGVSVVIEDCEVEPVRKDGKECRM